MGLALLHRDARSVTLTGEGHRLAESARRIVNELDLALTDLRDICILQTGSVALAAGPSLAVMWLPNVLRRFHARHPGIRLQLQLHDESSVQCHELVRQGIVDFALNSQPGTPHAMPAERLFEEPLYVVCPPEHALAGRALVSAGDLAGVRFLHLKGTDKMIVRTRKGQQTARNVFHAAGVVDTGFEVNSLVTLAGLVASGLGAGLAPETSLPLFQLLPTQAVRIDPQMMRRQIFFVHAKGKTPAPAAASMRELLFEESGVGRQPVAQPVSRAARPPRR